MPQVSLQEQNQVKLSPRSVWGKITIYLREHNNIILHIICGDIRDVDEEDGKFIIYASEYTRTVLQEENNYKELKKALEFFGYKEFEIRKKTKELSMEENLQILNKFFDNQVKVIDK